VKKEENESEDLMKTNVRLKVARKKEERHRKN
jgi:hypothetical protein